MTHQKEHKNPYQGLTREQVLDTMRQLVKEEDLNHYRMGLLYNYTVDSKLVQGTNYKNALEFFTANIQEASRSALTMYGAVAGAFSEPVCARFGITRLRLLLTYKAAVKLELNHDDPGHSVIQVPDEDGVVTPKVFSDCGVEDMRRALERLRMNSGDAPIPAEEVALVDRYRKAVVARFAKGTPVRVQLRSHQGTTVVDFKGIPVAQVDKLLEALFEQLYTPPEAPVEEKLSQAV